MQFNDEKIAELYVKAVPIADIVKKTGASKAYIHSLATLEMKRSRQNRQNWHYRKRTGRKNQAKVFDPKLRENRIIERNAVKAWNEKLLSKIQIHAPYVVKMMRYKRGNIAAEGMARFPSWHDLVRMWEACGGNAASDFVNHTDFREKIVQGSIINGTEHEAGEFMIERQTEQIPDVYDLLR